MQKIRCMIHGITVFYAVKQDPSQKETNAVEGRNPPLFAPRRAAYSGFLPGLWASRPSALVCRAVPRTAASCRDYGPFVPPPSCAAPCRRFFTRMRRRALFPPFADISAAWLPFENRIFTNAKSYAKIIVVSAGMLELADEEDSKSFAGNSVWVQVPLPAP